MGFRGLGHATHMEAVAFGVFSDALIIHSFWEVY